VDRNVAVVVAAVIGGLVAVQAPLNSQLGRTVGGVNASVVALFVSFVALLALATVTDGIGGIRRIGDAGFAGDDLLRAQRDAGRVLGRQSQRFIHRVGMQRLRAAQHSRQRLNGRADDVDFGLLRGQRRTGGLCVEAQHH